MNLAFWLRRPNLLFSRLRYWMWERLNPDKPWLCPGTVRFCEQRLGDSMVALEFGSGRSTRWFARRVARLVSIEHNLSWYEDVRRMLDADRRSNVDYRLITLDHPEAEPEHSSYSPLPRYVSVLDEFLDGTFDLIVVDGHYRTTCIRQAITKLKPGGFLLVDDTNLWPSLADLPVPSNWPLVDESTNGIKRTAVWQATSE